MKFVIQFRSSFVMRSPSETLLRAFAFAAVRSPEGRPSAASTDSIGRPGVPLRFENEVTPPRLPPGRRSESRQQGRSTWQQSRARKLEGSCEGVRHQGGELLCYIAVT